MQLYWYTSYSASRWLWSVAYPNDFASTAMDTNAIGVYTVIAYTEVGDPIVTTFATSFKVVQDLQV